MVVSSRILKKKKGVGGQERFEEAIGTVISSVFCFQVVRSPCYAICYVVCVQFSVERVVD